MECACSHLSIYTASAEIDTLPTYNEAFYAAGFICISGSSLIHSLITLKQSGDLRLAFFIIKSFSNLSLWLQRLQICSVLKFTVSLFAGFALAIISHVLCFRFPMFAAKLLTHMMVACLGTQVGQVLNYLLR